MPCHYYIDKTGSRHFIPDCWGSVIHGRHACTCVHKDNDQTLEQLVHSMRQDVQQLKKDVKRLNALIKRNA